MIRRKVSAAIVVALICFLCASAANAQCVEGGESAICPSADTIYINLNETLTALSLSSKSVKWHISLPEDASDHAGPAATANAVAVSSGFPGTKIEAFGAATGKLLWTINTSSHDFAAFGHYIFISDAEHYEAVTAVDDRTGKRVWHYSGTRPTGGGPWFLDQHDGNLLTNIFAINANSGQLLKRWPRAWRISNAVFAGDRVVLGTSWASGGPTKVAAYSLPSYQTLWVKDDAQKRATGGMAADAEHIFISMYDAQAATQQPGVIRLEMLNASSGDILWTKDVVSKWTQNGSVGLAMGIAVFLDVDPAGSTEVRGFDAVTGKQKWTTHVDRVLDGGITCVDSACYVEAIPAPFRILSIDVQTGAQSWFTIPNK